MSDMIAQHPDAEVARRWTEMARKTMGRYPGPPMPTHPVLDLDSVEGLSASQASAVHKLTERWLQSYFEDVRDQLMKVHGDLLKLQKTIAELEADKDSLK
ncbi:MAG: hypothetical protein AB8B64_18120 [Granulosicoccus sp.]